jgi:hypothetical protein
MVSFSMSKKPGVTFVRRAPDIITEELVKVLSSKATFEFKALFDIILGNLRERNAASGGEEMLRLRTYEKLQGLVNQGAVTRTVTGIVKKYKGVASKLAALGAEMKILRVEWNRKVQAKAAAAAAAA